MRTLARLVTSIAVLVPAALAQTAQTTYCDYTDGGEISIQYNSTVKEDPKNGRTWSPGITLFVQTPITLGGSLVSPGAYTVYLIPERKNWTLIVNKNVTAGTAYNSAQDVARAQMDLGEIPDPVKQLQLTFAHMSAKQCSLRIYYQKTGAFADFLEK